MTRRSYTALVAGITASLALVLTGCGEDLTAEPVDETSGEAATDQGAEGEDQGQSDEGPFAVGETVAMGDLEHTLHSARWVEGDEFFGPEEGERWIALDIEVTNTSDESSGISSMAMWNLVDPDNRTLDMEISGEEQGSLDGELGAGRSMRGELTYSVPEGQSSWELVFEPQMFGFGQAIYEIGEADVE